MTPQGVLGLLRGRGVYLRLEGGRLRFRALPGAYDTELRQLVAEHKPALVEHLAAQPNGWDQASANQSLADVLREIDRATGQEWVTQAHRCLMDTWRTTFTNIHGRRDPLAYHAVEEFQGWCKEWKDP